MKVCLIPEKKLAEYNDSYAARLIEHGKAVLAPPKKEMPKAAPKEVPAEAPEKTAKRGKAAGK